MKRRQSKRRRELEQFASTHGLSLSDECADPPGERFFLASLNTRDVLGVDDNPMCGSWKGVHLVEMAIEIAGDGFVVYQPLMDPENCHPC